MTTMGVWALENASGASVTVQSVSLPNSQGLRETKTWLVPIQGRSLIGNVPWPPTSPEWPKRVQAAGAVIGPHQALNLVLGVARTASKGTAGGPVVSYSTSNGTYTLNEATGLELTAQACPA
jgi:hypothetical protein